MTGIVSTGWDGTNLWDKTIDVVKVINKVIRFDAVKTGKQQTMPGLTDQSSQQLLGLEAYGSVRAVS